MVNLKCIFSYLGTYFHGSAEQVGIPIEIVPTVVGKIREVIEMVTQSKVRINLAGRTDRGVHARAQVANFFVDESNNPRGRRWRQATSAYIYTAQSINTNCR